MTSLRAIRIGTAAAAAGLAAWSTQLPLWQMTMRAPQYPKGLRLYAFGTHMQGDLSELNILNHYIGMPAIQAPALETSMFPVGIGLLVVLCLAAPAHAWLRRAAAATAALMPIGILADLQWRLYEFGHALNPTAPIRLKAFTPLVIGQTQMGNFVSTATYEPSLGMAFIQERLAQSAGYHVAAHDLDAARTDGAILLKYVTATDTPDTAPDAFDAQVRYLYLRATGLPLAADATEPAAAAVLWKQLYSVEANPTQAWAGIVSAVLRDPRVLFY